MNFHHHTFVNTTITAIVLVLSLFSSTVFYHPDQHYEVHAAVGEVTIIAKLSNNSSNQDKTVSVVLYGPNGTQLKQSEPITVQKGNGTTTVLIVQPSEIPSGSGFKVCVKRSQNCQYGINGPELVPEIANFTL